MKITDRRMSNDRTYRYLLGLIPIALTPILAGFYATRFYFDFSDFITYTTVGILVGHVISIIILSIVYIKERRVGTARSIMITLVCVMASLLIFFAVAVLITILVLESPNQMIELFGRDYYM